MRRAAIEVLERNRRRGITAWGEPYDFVCPSPTHYPFQWFWDSAFHAIALCHVDTGQAVRELRGLIRAARPDGFIPHMILWEKAAHRTALDRYNVRLDGEYWTATIQPPVLALALERVYHATGQRAVLDELLPATLAFFDWLAAMRDPDGDGLIAIIQPDESGLDASPKYDALMAMPSLDDSGLEHAMGRLFTAYGPIAADVRAILATDRFNVEDVLVNTIYIAGLGVLGELCQEVGDRHSAARLAALRERAFESLLARCWDGERGAFWDLAGQAEHRLEVLTVTSLIPLAIPDLPASIADTLVRRHLLNEQEFWLPYPVPSVAASEPTFEPAFDSGLIWRGPTWTNTNWFLIGGLRRHRFVNEAIELTERTLSMVAGAGFREFFNPLNGEGYGATSFGWTTLVLDLMEPP